jgi:hypothetical protein
MIVEIGRQELSSHSSLYSGRPPMSLPVAPLPLR